MSENVIVTSIKVRIKRIARHNEDYEKNSIDEKHINGSIAEFPRLEDQFKFSFDKLDNGWWMTTPVKYISFQDGKILFGTKNSVYEILDGWKGE